MAPAKVRMQGGIDSYSVLKCTTCGHVFLECDPEGEFYPVAEMAQLGELLTNHDHAHEVYD